MQCVMFQKHCSLIFIVSTFVTSHPSGISPIHSTPEGLYFGYGLYWLTRESPCPWSNQEVCVWAGLLTAGRVCFPLHGSISQTLSGKFGYQICQTLSDFFCFYSIAQTMFEFLGIGQTAFVFFYSQSIWQTASAKSLRLNFQKISKYLVKLPLPPC